TRYRPLFLLMQAMLVAMMISFPLQGYGAFPIVFSTIHTLCLAVFSFRLFADLRSMPASVSVWHTKASLIFFLISAVGPFAIAATAMMGLAQTQWYYFAVYYYLHFQYNGFFTFGVLALFVLVLESNKIQYDVSAMRSATGWLAIATVPSYFLSVLWAEPGIVYNIIAGTAALIQLYAAYIFLRVIFGLKQLHQFSKTYRF